MLALGTLLLLGEINAQGVPQGHPTEDFFAPRYDANCQCDKPVQPVAGQPVFSLNIRAAEGDQVMAGRDMDVEITLTNISKEDVYIAGINEYFQYILDVRGPDGQPRPLTKVGREALANRDHLMATGQPELLQAGESRKEILSASSDFDTWEVGMYTAQVRKMLSSHLGGGEVESNKIVFTVVYNPILDRFKEQRTVQEMPTSSPTPTPAKKPSSSPTPTPTPTPAKNR
jgi:hypothetical protein